jgi:hypothetical protein
MTKEQFTNFWTQNYPNTPPINHLFKHNLKERWLRIYSLPEAKRYADTPEEWAILLERQNTIFIDLMPTDTEICIVSGIYSSEGQAFDKAVFDELPYFKTLVFKELDALDLFKLSKGWYDEGIFYTPCFVEEFFTTNKFDTILKSIANDEWRLFFLDPQNRRIIAPYDGGLDLIFEDETALKTYKKKYENWCSPREDGL